MQRIDLVLECQGQLRDLLQRFKGPILVLQAGTYVDVSGCARVSFDDDILGLDEVKHLSNLNEALSLPRENSGDQFHR